MTVAIRITRDPALLAALHAACFADAWNEKAFAGILAMPGTLGWIAALDGAPAGFAVVRQAADEAEIISVGVVPEMRGRGMAGQLIRRAARGLENCATLFLEVSEHNRAARRLYRSLGFNEVGRRPKYYDNGADALVLARRLPFGCEADAPSLYSAGLNERDCTMPSNDQPSRLEQKCIDIGMRMTEQRRIIARVLSESEDHPDVEQVYQRASEVDENISIATVYRTVRMFEEANILERHDFGDGRARYEEAPVEHHDHLIDVNSGEVIEFRNEQIEELQRVVAEQLGYRLVGHRLELYGTRADRKND
ncbi:ribosomal-protein-alanine N-acetyltransferase [Minwuia thermotolerans]|uniref:Ferric uptake regulation protein n=2 Tax=Minwuia thermotolerans TaxID=2056226 RepID=A0A2M9G240_9PROT|nr:ribosomal protein S18-alanine N-acetyltransferase [Minwuia thermotolerans]PJK29797.1 ribosomal-protein-alanine N-acetyltransferase [Minwuia thermotolerans]